jgi:hypothetical protein
MTDAAGTAPDVPDPGMLERVGGWGRTKRRADARQCWLRYGVRAGEDASFS